jgi:hypothetical protein
MSSSLSDAFVASAALGAALVGNITAGVLDHYTLDKSATLSAPFIAAIMSPKTHNLDRASVLQSNVIAAQPIRLWDSWLNRQKVNNILYAKSYVRAQIDVLPDRYVADCTVAAMDANTQKIDMSKAKQCFGEISAQRREDKKWSNSIIGVAAFCSALFAAGWFSPQLKARMNANHPSQGPR